jgi:UDP-galactopyranose mutase|tara:strand:- start:273 stop:449 length:177 start_codon:yes stop_codon:yes gene_type:complete
MDKEYQEKLGNYKYRVLNFNKWNEYIKEEYQKTALKNINRKAKKQREQIKNSPLNFCI